MRVLLWVAFCVLSTATLSSAQPTACQSSPDALAFPNRPFQVTIVVPPPTAATPPRDTKEIVANAYQVPLDRYLVIRGVSLKGTQPDNGYLAIELRTAIAFGTAAVAARHFLYAKDGQSLPGRALGIAQPLEAYAYANSLVQIGVQASANANVDRLGVTLTGWLVDRCRWGK